MLLGEALQERQVRQIAYWYSMWSHRRDGIWKGFVQVKLDPEEDHVAQEILDAQNIRSTP